ncbi:MAG TPA: dihydropteroate synthase [Planctomycetota bacterium]|nr:dihydropteroate synthase [Planctomycetota bacterium]
MNQPSQTEYTVKLPRGLSLKLGPRTLIMGVLNVTPDSFSDGGLYYLPDLAVERAHQMIEAGADILDIGGESTRPGAMPVPPETELKRVIPVIEQISSRSNVIISIDTTKAQVAREALAAGASIVNDTTGLHGDPALVKAAANASAAVVAMHIKGTPRTMQQQPVYHDLIGEIAGYLRESIALAEANGVPAGQVIIDPGIGFGKTVQHNLEIMARLRELQALHRPILIGTSRKSTIGQITGKPVDQRIFGTAATVAICIINGAAIVRVHDVSEMVDVVKMADAIRSARRPNTEQ